MRSLAPTRSREGKRETALAFSSAPLAQFGPLRARTLPSDPATVKHQRGRSAGRSPARFPSRPLAEVDHDDTAIDFFVGSLGGAATLDGKLEPRLLGLVLALLLFPFSNLLDDERR